MKKYNVKIICYCNKEYGIKSGPEERIIRTDNLLDAIEDELRKEGFVQIEKPHINTHNCGGKIPNRLIYKVKTIDPYTVKPTIKCVIMVGVEEVVEFDLIKELPTCVESNELTVGDYIYYNNQVGNTEPGVVIDDFGKRILISVDALEGNKLKTVLKSNCEIQE